jgi:hypothetical protein
MHKLLPFMCVTLFHPLILDAQKDSLQKEQKLMIAALPFIASSPTTGFLVGASASLAKYMGPSETTHMSSAVFGIIATEKKQTYLTLKSTVFLKDDQWNLNGDWRYLVNSLPNYGLGTGPQSAKIIGSTGINYQENMWSKPISVDQQIEFKHIRIHEVFMKSVRRTGFYIGGGYRLDIHNRIKDNLLNLTDTPPTITSHYAYSKIYDFDPLAYTISSLSIDAVYDTRDNSNNAYKGRFANISYRISPEFLGSTRNTSSIWIEYREYIPLSKRIPRHLLGFWGIGHFQTSGHHGYLDLPATGFDQYSRSARPYTQGRFRGEELLYGESEYRFPIWKTWGGVAFVNASTVTNGNSGIQLFEYVDLACGFGLRWMVNKKSRTNITIDYGFGKYGAQGIIFNVSEVF